MNATCESHGEAEYTALSSLIRQESFEKRSAWRLPARHVLNVGLFFGFFMLYALRVNLSVAIVAMVNSTAISLAGDDLSVNSSRHHQECIPKRNKTSSEVELNGEFNWDENTQGIVLGSFFYGYVLTQLPGGRLAETAGAKWLLGLGIFITSVLTLLTPLAARTFGAPGLALLRVVEGLCEGVVFPSSMALLSHWSPVHERSRMISFNGIGTSVGTVVTLVTTAHLCATENGWPNAFYLFGILGCVWFVLWSLFIYETPETHPKISKLELHYIQKYRGRSSKEAEHVPWRELLTSVPVWSLGVTVFCANYAFYFLLIDLPNYLKNVLHYEMQSNGIQNALVHLAGAVSMLMVAPIADNLRRQKVFTPTTIRKSFQAIGLVGPALCLAAVPYAGCSHLMVITLLVAGMSLYGFTVGGQNPLPLDMAPSFAGTLMGLTNGFGNLSGMLAPLVTGWVIEHNDTLGQWKKLFLVAAAVNIFGAVQFALFGSADLQPWAKLSDRDMASPAASILRSDSEDEEEEIADERDACLPNSVSINDSGMKIDQLRLS